MNAEIMKAKGGASAIATMTFDDGLYKTAEKLNELCEKYDARASLMLCTHKVNDDTADYWRELFGKGYLFPESHSTRHHYLTNSHPENLTEEVITSEIEGSVETLKHYLPDYDYLSFGIPYSSYAPVAFEHLFRTFYSVRGGVCVLVNKEYTGQVQSLDPIPGSKAVGGWYQPLGIRVMPEKANVTTVDYSAITVENIIAHLDRCVERGGWFISGTHGIVEGENLDIKAEDLERILARMQEHSRAGRLWVTDVGTATKYMRERQNASLECEECEGGCTVTVTLAKTTADGLPLDVTATGSDGRVRRVFSEPLSVKLELPEGTQAVAYTLRGEEKKALAFTEGDRAYAYVDVVPSGDTVTVRFE